MSRVNLDMPESLLKQAREIAAQDEMTLDQLVASAVAEKVAAWQTVAYLNERAARGDREKFLRAMDKVPAVEPCETDHLP